MADRDIINILSTGTGVCGRLSSTQLSRELVAPPPPKRAFLPAALLASFIAAVMPDSSKAGQPIATTEQLSAEKKEVVALMRTYEGKVLNSNTREGVPRASVTLKGTSIGAVTEADGSFHINIPAEYFKSRFTLAVRCIGYQTSELVVDPELIPDFPTIELYPATTTLNEVEVVGSEEVINRQSYVGAIMTKNGRLPFFHWLKHPFRKCRPR